MCKEAIGDSQVHLAYCTCNLHLPFVWSFRIRLETDFKVLHMSNDCTGTPV